MALNNGIAGSPETVRRFIEAEVAANNCNYFVPQMVFGSMTLQERCARWNCSPRRSCRRSRPSRRKT
jgi:hypothetical protein